MASWLDQFFAPEPTAPLDVSTTGTINNLPIADLSGNPVSALRFTGAAPTLTGMAPLYPGQRISLMAVGGPLVIANAAATSSAGYRILTGTGANITVPQDGTAWLVNDAVAQRWRLSSAVQPVVTIPDSVASKLASYDGSGGFAVSTMPVPPTADGTYRLSVVSGVLTWVNDVVAFDPATLALTRWWRGSFAAAPWSGTASAGVSGATTLASIDGNVPTAGTAVNGYTPAVFNGTGNQLGDGTVASAFAVGAFSGWDLVYLPTLATDPGAGSRRNAPAIWDDSGDTLIQLTAHAGGATIAYVGGGGLVETTSAITAAAWALVQYKFDGTNLKLRVNNGTWASNACTARASFTNNLRYGKNWQGTYTSMRVEDSGKTNTVLSDANFDSVRGALNTRYGLSL